MNQHVNVRIDLRKVRSNAVEIGKNTGVDVLAVIKADAYGLGAYEVARAMAEVVEGFCFFSLKEAIAAKLDPAWRRPAILLGPPGSMVPHDYLSNDVRPAVSNEEQARTLQKADPVLCVDAGMQRFACPADQVERVITVGGCREAFAHAPTMEHVKKFVEIAGKKNLQLHAAASSLLDERSAWLDAVRPGIALYRDAVRVAARLVEVHESRGPAGYSGFVAQRFGVILCGYSNGLRKGPCVINGKPWKILEVGMQSAFVEIGFKDKVGDEVVLMGDGLMPEEISKEWGCTPHEAMVRLAGSGERQYIK
jgi:alanine racemase